MTETHVETREPVLKIILNPGHIKNKNTCTFCGRTAQTKLQTIIQFTEARCPHTEELQT